MISRMWVACVLAVGIAAGVAQAQVPAPQVVMLSDIHFDPFHDPAKFAALEKATVSAWPGILAEADSAGQAAAFDALQTACRTRGVDTPMELLTGSLRAEHAAVAKPLFVTVSGDLMAHKFDCRYETLARKAGMTVTAAAYAAFAAKTVAFVALELRRTFPGVPVYLALGNNDSGCRDYDEDAGGAFLQAYAHTAAADALTPANSEAIAREASEFGDYNIALPLPHTRLIVLQNIFESAKYSGCDGKPPAAGSVPPQQAQQAWLRMQLARARAAHERVWVMAHIPPGVDAYSTFKSGGGVCEGKVRPTSFLASDEFAANLGSFADVIKLVLLGHTHMDEMRAYASLPGRPKGVVPGKLVPSISPVNGNTPAFTVGEVDPATATLKDYAVFAAGSARGGGSWTEEYRYSATYGEPDFSGTSVKALTGGFIADKLSEDAKSQAYERFYFVGEPLAGMKGAAKAAALSLVWPGYACSITQPDAQEFDECVCRAGAAP